MPKRDKQCLAREIKAERQLQDSLWKGQRALDKQRSRALKLQARETARRLQELNGEQARERQARQDEAVRNKEMLGTYLRLETYEVKHQELQHRQDAGDTALAGRISKLELWQANVGGRTIAIMSGIAAATSIIGGIIGMWIGHLITK